MKRAWLPAVGILLVVLLLTWTLRGDEARDVAGGPSSGTTSERPILLEGRDVGSEAEGDPEVADVPVPSGEPMSSLRLVAELRPATPGPRLLAPITLVPEGEAAEIPDSPLEGMEVVVVLEQGGEARELGRATLDPKGRIEMDLPEVAALTSLARASSTLHVRPVDPAIRIVPAKQRSWSLGAYREFAELRGTLPASGLIEIIVTVLPADVAFGRVVDEAGEPVPDAYVRASAKGAHDAEACTDPDGRFAFAVSTAGTYFVSVRLPDGRTGGLEDVGLAPGASRDLGDVVARPSERRFRGRVRYPDGAPVVGIRLDARHMDTRFFGGSLMLSDVPCRLSASHLWTRTDAEGGYELHPAGWTVDGETDLWSLRVEVPATAPDVRRTPHDALDVVVRGHRLRIRVADSEGRAVPRALVSILPPNGTTRGSDSTHAQTDDRGIVDAWLERGRKVRIAIALDGAAPVLRELDVPTTANESVVDVVLAPLDPGTGVRIDGTPDHPDALPAFLWIQREGLDLWAGRVDPEGVRVPLAPGTYDLVLRSQERAPWNRRFKRWQPMRTTVEVEPGKITRVPFEPELAAHLVVETVDPNAASGAELAELMEDLLAGRDVDRGLAALDLEGDDGDIRVHDAEGSLVAELFAGAHFAWDRTYAPDTYTVTVEFERARDVTKTVELRAGEVTVVVVRREPE